MPPARLLRDAELGKVDADSLDEKTFAAYLYDPEIPDPDLLIRTGAESRVSNFLLWQIAYSEIYTTDLMWPDFRKEHLVEALVDYQARERRFGRRAPRCATRRTGPSDAVGSRSSAAPAASASRRSPSRGPFPTRYRVTALAAGRNVEKLAEQVLRFRPEVVSVADAEGATQLRERLGRWTWSERGDPRSGDEGLEAVATHDADLVVAGLVGAVGLRAHARRHPRRARRRAGQQGGAGDGRRAGAAARFAAHGVTLCPSTASTAPSSRPWRASGAKTWPG